MIHWLESVNQETLFSSVFLNHESVDSSTCFFANLCEKADCFDTKGSYTCSCKTGFTGNGISCLDIDECVNNMDNCDTNATCVNAQGSFGCSCKNGYVLKGTLCSDVDECSSYNHDCRTDAKCVNTEGSFDCSCDAENGQSCTNDWILAFNQRNAILLDGQGNSKKLGTQKLDFQKACSIVWKGDFFIFFRRQILLENFRPRSPSVTRS